MLTRGFAKTAPKTIAAQIRHIRPFSRRLVYRSPSALPESFTLLDRMGMYEIATADTMPASRMFGMFCAML